MNYPTRCCCGSESLSWVATSRIKNDVQQGRLRTSDVESLFALGCDDCSETLQVVSADTVADHLNGKGANHG
jgi:hypothetical protein